MPLSIIWSDGGNVAFLKPFDTIYPVCTRQFNKTSNYLIIILWSLWPLYTKMWCHFHLSKTQTKNKPWEFFTCNFPSSPLNSSRKASFTTMAPKYQSYPPFTAEINAPVYVNNLTMSMNLPWRMEEVIYGIMLPSSFTLSLALCICAHGFITQAYQETSNGEWLLSNLPWLWALGVRWQTFQFQLLQEQSVSLFSSN